MEMIDMESSVPDERLMESAGGKLKDLRNMKKHSFEQKKNFDSKNEQRPHK